MENLDAVGINVLIDNAPIGICILDAKTLIAETVNDSFIAVAGKRRDEIIGQFYWDTFAEVRDYYETPLAKVAHDGEPFSANEVALELIRNGKLETVYVTFVYSPLKKPSGAVEKIAIWVLENTLQVAERQKVLEAQQKAELAISSANLGVFEFYYASETLIANDRFNEIFDCSGFTDQNEFLKKLHPGDRPARDDAHRVALQTGQLNYEARIIRGNGSICWARFSGKVLFDEDHEPEKMIGICQDVTDTVVAHKKIAASEQILRNMIIQAPVAMCMLDGPNHNVVVANSKMIEIWGKSPSELLNKPIFEGLSEAKEQGLEKLLQSVYETGLPFVANEHPVKLPRNGKMEQTYLNFTYDAIKDDYGVITGIFAVAVDVTEQVQAREKIQHLVDQRTAELRTANEALLEKNGELAQFAYIASHDLQEPLRKIGTYASRLEADIAQHNDANSKLYLEKIRAASDRMGNLITDILAYSSLPKKEDIFENVDLNLIAKYALGDFDLVLERTGASVTWNKLPTVRAIPTQMAQLFGNMIGNALKFLRRDNAPNITISCSKASDAEILGAELDRARNYHKLQFSDNGIGIAPENTKKIFSVFQRLHSKSEFEGTGIGLAMCKKIALNHHGDIDASESNSTGAVFNVYLPMS